MCHWSFLPEEAHSKEKQTGFFPLSKSSWRHLREKCNSFICILWKWRLLPPMDEAKNIGAVCELNKLFTRVEWKPNFQIFIECFLSEFWFDGDCHIWSVVEANHFDEFSLEEKSFSHRRRNEGKLKFRAHLLNVHWSKDSSLKTDRHFRLSLSFSLRQSLTNKDKTRLLSDIASRQTTRRPSIITYFAFFSLIKCSM